MQSSSIAIILRAAARLRASERIRLRPVPGSLFPVPAIHTE